MKTVFKAEADVLQHARFPRSHTAPAAALRANQHQRVECLSGACMFAAGLLVAAGLAVAVLQSGPSLPL